MALFYPLAHRQGTISTIRTKYPLSKIYSVTSTQKTLRSPKSQSALRTSNFTKRRTTMPTSMRCWTRSWMTFDVRRRGLEISGGISSARSVQFSTFQVPLEGAVPHGHSHRGGWCSSPSGFFWCSFWCPVLVLYREEPRRAWRK